MIEIIETEPTLLEKIRKISEHYSPEHQLEKAKEELRELLEELEAAQIINGELILPGNTWSEVGDVNIMNIQLAMQHKKEKNVLNQMEYKVNRQLKRIEAEKKE
ncbi:MAG TPA: hypothetical protein IAA26_05125 [Candidatus Blautia faecipullorum]|nr:hypothetical protein [Candidatus Blautia faecipullorum]